MLLLLAAWLILTVSSTVAGAALLRLAGLGDEIPDGAHRLVFQCAAGLLALPSLLLPFSFLGPLHPGWAMVVYLALPAALLSTGGVRRELRRARITGSEAAAGAMILAVCAWNASGVVVLYDTGLYHYPLIQWLGRFGTVSGQAILHHRFGFPTTWFALPAACDSGFLHGRLAAVLNGLVFAVVCFHTACAVAWLWRRDVTPQLPHAEGAGKLNAYFAGAYAVLILFGNGFQRLEVSPSPNYPLAWAAVLAGGAMLSARGGSPAGCAVAVLFGACALAIKLSGALVLATSLVALVLSIRMVAGWRARLRALPWGAMAVAALLAAPTPAANRIASGCPLFPSALFCAGGPDTLPVARARAVEQETRGWARYGGPYPQDAAFLELDWLPAWLGKPAQAGFAALSCGCLILLVALRRWSSAASMAASGTLFVMLSAPDLRFVFGYTAAWVGACAAALLPRLRLPSAPWRAGAMTLALAAAGSLCVLCHTLIHEAFYRDKLGIADARSVTARLLLPAPVRWSDGGMDAVRTEQVNDIRYRRPPSSDQCWGIAQPCTPYPPAESVSPSVRLCDPSRGLRGGICRTP